MAENNQMMSVEGQLVGLPLAGPESFSQQQLEYLKRALGVDETVLWEGAETIANNLEITLGEKFNNFERIRIYGEPWENWMPELWVEFFTDSRGTTKQISISPSYLGASGAAIRIAQMMLTLSTNKITVTNTNLFSVQGTAVSTSSLVSTVIRKVVGINRIAGGN